MLAAYDSYGKESCAHCGMRLDQNSNLPADRVPKIKPGSADGETYWQALHEDLQSCRGGRGGI
jgi:hypothetical protein